MMAAGGGGGGGSIEHWRGNIGLFDRKKKHF